MMMHIDAANRRDYQLERLRQQTGAPTKPPLLLAPRARRASNDIHNLKHCRAFGRDNGD